jgi:hypothetical protein
MTLVIQIIVFIAFSIGIGVLIKMHDFFQLKGIPSRLVVSAFFLKVFVGIGLWALYTFVYTERANADIYKYYDDGYLLFLQLRDQPVLAFKFFFGIQDVQISALLKDTMHWDREYNFGVLNDNRTMIRFNFLASYFSHGFIHLHTLFINFLSFTGLVALYKTINRQLTLPAFALFFAVFLIPSTLLWGSGILKEGFLLFSLGIFTLTFFNWLAKTNLRNSGYLIIGTALLAIIKPYVLLSLIPVVAAASAIRFLKIKPIIAYLGVISIDFFGVVLLKQFHLFDLFDLLQQKQTAFYNVAMMSESGSVVSVSSIQTPLEALFAIPEVLVNVLFRPFITEVNSIFYLLAAAENLMLLILIVTMLLFFKKPTINQLNFLFFGLFFTLILGTLIGWTTPILGAVVRYKVPFLPFLFALIFSCIDFNKINQKFNLSIR